VPDKPFTTVMATYQAYIDEKAMFSKFLKMAAG
jgi:hypothetical protein